MLLLCLLNHEFLRGNNCLISFSRYKKGGKCSSFAIFAHKSFQFLLYNTRSLENRSTFFTTFGAKIQIRLVLADFHTLSEGLVSHFWSFVLVRKTFFNVPQSLRLVWQDEEWFYCQWFFLSLLSLPTKPMVGCLSTSNFIINQCVKYLAKAKIRATPNTE